MYMFVSIGVIDALWAVADALRLFKKRDMWKNWRIIVHSLVCEDTMKWPTHLLGYAKMFYSVHMIAWSVIMVEKQVLFCCYNSFVIC
jgi:hypothetical protein